MDVEKAFLQSGPIERIVYVRPPKEAGTSSETIWRLNTAAYGLTDAARKWYSRLYSIRGELGLQRSATEPAVIFLKSNEGKLREILMACLSTMVNNRWKLHSMDVEKAFLQSGPIERIVYVRPPKEAGTSSETIWRLNTAAYGLTDAARKWYSRLYSILGELGLQRSATEPAVFYLKSNEGKLRGILITHVDDFCLAGIMNS